MDGDNGDTPLSVSFGEMHIRTISPPTSPPTSARRLPGSHLAKRADAKRHSWGGQGLLGGKVTPKVIKVGTGEKGLMRKVKAKKKPRPFPLQKRSTELCLAFMTKRFTEEEAELATLSLDFAEELERRQQKDTGLRCPAPDPSAMNRRYARVDYDEDPIGDEVPFMGLHTRPHRTRTRFAPPLESELMDSSSSDDDFSESTPTKEIKSVRAFARPMDVDIPVLDFGKLTKVLSPRPGTPGSSILSPHASPPHTPSSPPGISKPDCAKYTCIHSSPRSAFVKPNSA